MIQFSLTALVVWRLHLIIIYLKRNYCDLTNAMIANMHTLKAFQCQFFNKILHMGSTKTEFLINLIIVKLILEDHV